jgi:hypothetical protein
MMTTSFKRDVRIKWIKQRLEETGHVGRTDLVIQFGVSSRIAASDLALARDKWPDIMVYSYANRRYEQKN